MKLIFTILVYAVISWVAFLVVVALLNDFGILNTEHILIYYISIFVLLLSANYYK